MEYLGMSHTGCVHFVRKTAETEGLQSLIEASRIKGIKCCYWSYLDGGRTASTITNPLGAALGLEHLPYAKLAWTRFLDDLITLAYRYSGLMIMVDRADLLHAERNGEMLDCIEAFLIQFHHWYDQKKPCHLYFQMIEDPPATDIFSREAALL